MIEPKVGQIVTLKKHVLGNQANALGVCYGTYPGDREGKGNGGFYIFENGQNDGFSFDDIQYFLEEAGFSEDVAEYQYLNDIQMLRDYRAGRFNGVFRPPIVVTVEGGVIHSVNNLPTGMKLIICDLDTEGGSPENIYLSPYEKNPSDNLVYLIEFDGGHDDGPLHPQRALKHPDGDGGN